MEIPAEARTCLRAARRGLAGSLAGAYLHGSAVAGGLRPQSDVDIILAVEAPMSGEVRHRLLEEVMAVSGRHPCREGRPRPIELIAFTRAELASPAFPARADFVYGEWLRDAFEAGATPEPESDPEYTLLLAQARQDAVPLSGPPLAELLPTVPDDHIRRAIGDALGPLLGSLEHDTRNVLLTLARMWRTLAVGDFVAKDVAAEWAARHLPAEDASVLLDARNAYLVPSPHDRLRPAQAGQTAALLQARIAAEQRAATLPRPPPPR